MRKALIICLLSTRAWAACPLYNYRDNPQIDQEFQNICANITNPVSNTVTANQIVLNGAIQFKAITLAQINATVPTSVGQVYYCSNCTTDAVCVSTATKAASFTRFSARTTACQ